MGQALSASCPGTLGRKDETQSPWHTLGSFTAQERKKKTEVLVRPQPKYSHKKKN